MLKLVMLVVAGLALSSGEAERTFSHEMSNHQLTLHAGIEQEAVSQEEPTERSVLISNRIKEFAMEHIRNMPDPLKADVPTITLRSGSATGMLYRLLIHSDNTEMRGISAAYIRHLNFSLLRMNLRFDLWIPDIIFETNYAAELRMLLMLTHRAAGTARVMARGIHVDGFMQLGLTSGGNLQCTALDINLDIGHTHTHVTEITGLVSLDWILNLIVQNGSANAVQESLDELSQVVSDAVFDMINDILIDFTLADLLG